MNTYIPIIGIIATLAFTGCVSERNALTIVDDSLDPRDAENQLVLGDCRGSVGHHTFVKNSGRSRELSEGNDSGSRKWVSQHWGTPDDAFSRGGYDVLVYRKKSREAPLYQFQEEGHVELTYRGNDLVSISMWAPNCPPYMKGPVYVLPK